MCLNRAIVLFNVFPESQRQQNVDASCSMTLCLEDPRL